MPDKMMKKFFGENARPVAEIVMRRHPLAFAMYAIVFLLGMIFLTHLGYGVHTEAELFPGVSQWTIWGWKVMMVTGGGGALTFLSVNPHAEAKWPDLTDLLHLEGITAIVGAFGITTYLVAVISVMGWAQSGPSLAFFGLMVLGQLWRAQQAIIDARRLQKLATTIDTEQERRDDLPS